MWIKVIGAIMLGLGGFIVGFIVDNNIQFFFGFLAVTLVYFGTILFNN